ncbi:MAG TPA: hypothetical protein PK556_12730, partial [Smithellaceae bacterium]|nr:hypothetical protein [Smithellaceae bacterium]
VAGHVKTAKNSKSKYEGLWDTEETDRQVKPLDAAAGGGSPLWDVSEEVHENAGADMSGQSAGGVGVVIEASSRKNEAGLYDNRKTTRTAKPYGPKSDAHGSALVDETTEYYRNQDAFPNPGAPAVGSTVDVSGSINDYGKIDYQKTTRVDKPFDTGLVATGGDSLKIEQSQIKLNQPSVTVSPIAGKVVSAGISVGESGRINARITQITPIAADSGWISYQDRYGLSYFRSFKNQASVPTNGFTDKTSNSLYAIKNEFGLWDGTASRSAVRDDSGGSVEDDAEVNYTIDIAGTSYKISEKITGSLTRAQAHILGTNTGGSGKTPGIVYIGHGKYKATKVIVVV